MSTGYSQSLPPAHLCFFFLILSMFLGITWYVNYESVFEGIFDQFKLVLMVSPLLLLLGVHLLAVMEPSFSFIPFPEKESFHNAGGTPWGVGAVLLLLFFMISYQSDFRERWFPLLS